MKWSFSNDPNDWAAQAQAFFSAASAIFTGMYVWLTYRLMRATARTAEIAFSQSQRESGERLLSIRHKLDSARQLLSRLDPLNSAVDSSVEILSGLTLSLLGLDSLQAAAYQLSRELSIAMSAATRDLRLTQVIAQEVITHGSTEVSGNNLAIATTDALKRVEHALKVLDTEILRRGIELR